MNRSTRLALLACTLLGGKSVMSIQKTIGVAMVGFLAAPRGTDKYNTEVTDT